MIYYDKKAYEQRRDIIIKCLKPLMIGLTLIVGLSALACYNAVRMNAPGESRLTCQNDSDCRDNYVCVRNISPISTLGECVDMDEYDPWANRQLEDLIKLKNKKSEKIK